MAQYLVTMSLAKAEPLIDIGHLTNIVTEKVLPSLDALKDLQSKGKVLAGGHPVGQHYVMLAHGGRVGGGSAQVGGGVASVGAGGHSRDGVKEL